MTALDAIAPTTAALHRHVAAAAAPLKSQISDVKSERDFSHAKYLILEAPGNHRRFAIIFDHHLQHDTMVPSGYRAVSAGFVMVFGDQMVIPDIDSTTLNLGPDPEDRGLISQLLNR